MSNNSSVLVTGTDRGEKLGCSLNVGGGLLDGAAGSGVSSLGFFQSLFHSLCRVLHICSLLTEKGKSKAYAVDTVKVQSSASSFLSRL